jgi:hypothetical protein
VSEYMVKGHVSKLVTLCWLIGMLFKKSDPYDPLSSVPIEQRANPTINRLYKCTLVKSIIGLLIINSFLVLNFRPFLFLVLLYNINNLRPKKGFCLIMRFNFILLALFPSA